MGRTWAGHGKVAGQGVALGRLILPDEPAMRPDPPRSLGTGTRHFWADSQGTAVARSSGPVARVFARNQQGVCREGCIASQIKLDIRVKFDQNLSSATQRPNRRPRRPLRWGALSRMPPARIGEVKEG